MTEWRARYGGPVVGIYLACRAPCNLYLLTTQDLLVIRGGGHDPGRIAPLY
jgi:hypothetical protein